MLLAHYPLQPSRQTDEPLIDLEIFRQILELDEDDSHEFSREMAFAFFSQAETTFNDMDLALCVSLSRFPFSLSPPRSTDKNLAKLSSLGHFLKGSSATLGVFKVQEACEKIQNYGQLKNDAGEICLSSEEALERIRRILPEAKSAFRTAERALRQYFKGKVEESED